MGLGYSFKCENCKEEYFALLGIGENELELRNKVTKDIKKGKYGEELKEVIGLSKYIVVNVSKSIYMCEKCGMWDDNFDLVLYAPKNIKEVENLVYGEKTVKELRKVPYIREDDKNKFCVISKIVYECPNCRIKCKKIEIEDFDKLSCLKCKSSLKHNDMIYWD